MPKRKPGRPRSEVEMSRTTYYLPKALLEKVGDYAYWERISASDLITDLLLDFFSKHRVKPRPKTKNLAERARAKGLKL